MASSRRIKSHALTASHFRDARTVTVTASDGTTQDVQARVIVIATGSEPISLPTVPFDGERIVSSTEALAFSEVPKHLVVIGGGAIGLELGSVWLRLGAKVTVVELLPRLVPGIDTQIASALQQSLTKQGFSFMLGSKVTQAAVKNGEVTLTVENDKKELKELTADRVLVAVGRKAYTNGLGAAEIGVAFDERGRIKVDHHYQTNVPGVYAIGDAIAALCSPIKPKKRASLSPNYSPGRRDMSTTTLYLALSTLGLVASVGLSEEAAKASEIPYKVGTFSFLANGRARCMDEADGMVKVIADAKTDRILGVHIVGPRASDIISEAVMAMEFGASAEDMGARNARSPHPSRSLARSGVKRRETFATELRIGIESLLIFLGHREGIIESGAKRSLGREFIKYLSPYETCILILYRCTVAFRGFYSFFMLHLQPFQ